MHAEHIVHRGVFFQFSKLRRKWTCFNNIFPPLRPTQDMAQCQNVSKMEVKRTVFLSHISHITQQNGRKPVFWQAGLAHGKITHPLWDRLWEYLLSDTCFLYFLCSFDAFSLEVCIFQSTWSKCNDSSQRSKIGLLQNCWESGPWQGMCTKCHRVHPIAFDCETRKPFEQRSLWWPASGSGNDHGFSTHCRSCPWFSQDRLSLSWGRYLWKWDGRL